MNVFGDEKTHTAGSATSSSLQQYFPRNNNRTPKEYANMDMQEFDRSGRLTKEDELMMAKPVTRSSGEKDFPDPSGAPQLSSTPQKHTFMHQEKLKKMEMPKKFQL